MKKCCLTAPGTILILVLICTNPCNGQASLDTPNKSQQIHEFPIPPNEHTDKQIAEYIRNIFQDKNGGLWFGTNNYGVAYFNGEKVSYFSNEEGFGGVQITGITEYLEGNLWLSLIHI